MLKEDWEHLAEAARKQALIEASELKQEIMELDAVFFPELDPSETR